MAEGFEPYHVPQQSRRDKLRIVAQNHPGCVETTAGLQPCTGLLPLYDPSLLSSDLLNCANNSSHEFHHHNNPISASGEQVKDNPVCAVKEEGVNLMGFVGGIVNGSSSSSTSHHPYLDPQSTLHMNPSSILDINNNPFLYTTHNLHNLRDFDQSYNGGSSDQVVVFKPEPLSLSLSSHSTHHNNLPLELNLQRYGSAIYGDRVTSSGYVVPSTVGGGASTSNEASRSAYPFGPFTGYASILKGSRFLKPAQQLLEEFCDVGQGVLAEKVTVDSSLMDPPSMNLNASGIVDDSLSCGEGSENRKKKSRLISMLDEVCFLYYLLFSVLLLLLAQCVFLLYVLSGTYFMFDMHCWLQLHLLF